MSINSETLQLRIGQLAQLTGVTPKTIRHYHKIGLLPNPERGENDYRLYKVADLYRLKLVLRLKEVGFSLADIRDILQSGDPDKSLKEKLFALERELAEDIAQLERQRARVEEILSEHRSLQAFARPDSESLTHQFLLETLTEYAARTPAGIQALDQALLARLDAFQWGKDYREYWEKLARSLSQHAVSFQKANEMFAASAHLEPNDPQLDILADAIAREIQSLQSALTLPNMEPPLQEVFQTVAAKSLGEVLTPAQQQLVGLIRKNFTP